MLPRIHDKAWRGRSVQPCHSPVSQAGIVWKPSPNWKPTMVSHTARPKNSCDRRRPRCAPRAAQFPRAAAWASRRTTFAAAEATRLLERNRVVIVTCSGPNAVTMPSSSDCGASAKSRGNGLRPALPPHAVSAGGQIGKRIAALGSISGR